MRHRRLSPDVVRRLRTYIRRQRTQVRSQRIYVC